MPEGVLYTAWAARRWRYEEVPGMTNGNNRLARRDRLRPGGDAPGDRRGRGAARLCPMVRPSLDPVDLARAAPGGPLRAHRGRHGPAEHLLARGLARSVLGRGECRV